MGKLKYNILSTGTCLRGAKASTGGSVGKVTLRPMASTLATVATSNKSPTWTFGAGTGEL